MPEVRYYKVTQIREVEVKVATDDSYQQEALKEAERIFLNPTPELLRGSKAPQVTDTTIERIR